MATVSASQPISTITPPHSSDGRTSWDYAVPLDQENVALEDSRFTSKTAVNRQSTYDTRQPSQQRNGTSKRTNTMDSSRTTKSAQSVDPRQAGKLTRKASNLSAGGDLTGHGDSYRSASEGKRKLPLVEPALDDSKWIHRDKLAQIESKELEEAGFRVPRKTTSRATSSRSSSRHRPEKQAEASYLESEFIEEPHGAFVPQNDKRQRTMSPSRVVEEEDASNGMNFELRTPEEVAAERELMSKQSPRPGTSRIPVKKTSPMPFQSNFVDRDSPLPRSRSGSAAWTSLPDDLGGPQDEDVHSAVLVDDEPSTPPATYTTHQSAQRSPPKAKVPAQTNPTSGARKTSSTATRKPSATAGTRNPSANSPTKRPGTSSGRPSTSHMNAPEGDPPWIASMYKPDPRLPPDQQILPTHAKRMAQEQWEKDGKTGTVYDREFRLLNDEQPQAPPLANRLERKSSPPHRLASKENVVEDGTKREDMPVWPLAPPLQKRMSAATSIGRPGTSGTDHGGYSIMPSLNSPKHPPSSPNPAVPSPKPVEVMRMQDPESGPQFQEIEKKKGGCGCCVVM